MRNWLHGTWQVLASVVCCALVASSCGGGGSGPDSVDPLPEVRGEIASFVARNASLAAAGSDVLNVPAGQAVSLEWTASGSPTLNIDGGVGDVTGKTSIVVVPSTSTVYWLTATWPNGASQKRSVTVQTAAALTPPVISEFASTTLAVNLGQSARLSWSVQGAESIALNNGVGDVTHVSALDVTPTKTTTYVLTATNRGGITLREMTVVVLPAAPDSGLKSFVASATETRPGQAVKLSWSVAGVEKLSIDQGIGDVTQLSSIDAQPSVTTTYVLSATFKDGSAPASLSLTVTVVKPTPPVVEAFTASPNVITAGGSATLNWTVSGATTISIDQGAVSVTSAIGRSVMVRPLATTTYTLSATNASGTTTKTVTLTVNPAPVSPVIKTFVAASTTITAGTSTTLSWDTSAASALSITPTVGSVAVPSGSTTVSPTSTTTYTLTASGASGTAVATKTVTITVNPAPVSPGITPVGSTALSVTAGQDTLLSWNVTGADRVTLEGIGDVTQLSSFVVRPTVSTIYVLTATFKDGRPSATLSFTVTVLAPPVVPVVSSFSASPGTVTVGQSTTLSWATSGASTLSITPTVGAVSSASGAIPVSPASTTTYTLMATNASGTTTKTVTVTVNPAPVNPAITSFVAAATSIAAGTSTTLSWVTTGAGAWSITPAPSGAVTSASGSTTVSPTSTTTYTLTASGASGTTPATKTVTITVNPPVTFTIGGTLSGLGAGKSVTLLNNAGNPLSLAGNGSFTFSSAIASGSAYNVSVGTQPVGQTCSVTAGAGTASANVTNVAVSCVDNSTVVSKTITYSADNGAGTMVAHTANVYYPGSLAVGEKRPVIVILPGWGGAGDVAAGSNSYWASQGYVAVNIGFKFVSSWNSNLWQSIDGALSALQADTTIPANNNVVALNGTSYGGTQAVVAAQNITHKAVIRAVLSEDAGYTWWAADPSVPGNSTAAIVPSTRPYAIAMQEQQGDTTFPMDLCTYSNCGIRNRATSHQNSATAADRLRVYSNCPAGGNHGVHPDAVGWALWRLNAMKQMLHTDYNATKFAGYTEPTVVPTNACVVTGHPRLWLTAADLPRLQSWATGANPLYQDGLKVVATRAKADMDRGDVARDCGTREWEEFPTEMYAELFAFMSLVESDVAARNDYAARARTLLMSAINQAALGPATARNHACGYPPFRDPEFFTTDSNRARWHGEAFPLVVDWIYPSLSTQDKQTIRAVFLRWSQEIIANGYHHPEQVGVVNSASLLSKPQVRWAGNNYFTAHMRNLGMMALALDPSDDAGNQLRNNLGNATGAWLYIFDNLTRTDSQGGLLPEGFEYSPQTASYAAQFLLALRTAGVDTCGAHCQMSANPFWNDFVNAYYHSLSPATIADPDSGGTAYLPASYGDAQNYRTPDFIDSFGAIGLYDTLSNNASRLNAVRWAQRNTAPGGTATFYRRVSNSDDFRHSLLYFMLYNPSAASASDPRPGMALLHFASGMNKVLVRTGWDTQASWFTYTLGWNFIDHQTADGNNFAWYRRGEWLTKARSGYPDIAEGIGSSEFYNTMALQNRQPARDPSDWRTDLWQRGSQWNYVAAGSPSLLARSDQPGFTYAMGDATNLYNSSSEGVTDIIHASRSIVWLKQEDAVVVYDRGQSSAANRFKRWWLQLANPATVSGTRATSTTPGGQQLTVTSLLPSAVALSAVGSPGEPIESQVAQGEPMKVRLRIEAVGNPASVRFLNVLQASNVGVSQSPVATVQNAALTWSGAQTGTTVVMFPVTVGQAFDGLTYTTTMPAGVHIVTGLLPRTGYAASRSGNTVSIQSGGSQMTDAGGVLELR